MKPPSYRTFAPVEAIDVALMGTGNSCILKHNFYNYEKKERSRDLGRR